MNEEINEYIAYVGTYTNTGSEGIYTYSLDIETGYLNIKENSAPKLENPSYLTIDEKNNYLYAVIENDVFNKENGGGTAAFSINPSSGRLTLLNKEPTKGKAPCHLCLNREKSFLYVANYTEGTLTTFPINYDGTLSPLSSIEVHTGTGPNPERQEKAHVHFVSFTPDHKYLLAVDLGMDKVMVYEPNKDNSELTLREDLCISVKSGSGPRHLDFHPNGKYIYLINELSSEVATLTYNNETGIIEPIQYISTLPNEYSGTNTCGAIHISKDGNFLYASNRGLDSIVVYKIDLSSGMLTLVSMFSTEGKCPRDFSIDPSGRHLLVANQESDSIVSFEINSTTGICSPTGYITYVKKPVCIKFMKLCKNTI